MVTTFTWSRAGPTRSETNGFSSSGFSVHAEKSPEFSHHNRNTDPPPLVPLFPTFPTNDGSLYRICRLNYKKNKQKKQPWLNYCCVGGILYFFLIMFLPTHEWPWALCAELLYKGRDALVLHLKVQLCSSCSATKSTYIIAK